MDRARTELLELEAIYQELPEFRQFTHRVPFLTKKQQHRVVLRMARLVKRQGECLLWCGHCNNDGYPKLNAVVYGTHRSLYVHHLSFAMANGREPRQVFGGGESGPKARPTWVQALRSLRYECLRQGVAFFFKQWGEWAPASEVPKERWRNPHDYVDGVYMMRVGKKNAGRMLDGREHSELVS